METPVKKGIILAGGDGNRLYPLNIVASKQLQPVYDKPMIYYPLSTLMMTGITEILIISKPHDIPAFKSLLGDGSSWGISISYSVQLEPRGIAEAFIVGERFIGSDSVCLILGDNIFYGPLAFLRDAIDKFSNGATIFGYYVNDPERYGVIEFSGDGMAISIEEKPRTPKSNYVVPGLYIYDNQVVEISKKLKPSDRGELEITDVNLEYLRRNELNVVEIGRGIAWLDTGTHTSLLDASLFFGTLEARQGLKIACLEEIAFRFGYIDEKDMLRLIDEIPESSYRDYLLQVLEDAGENQSPF